MNKTIEPGDLVVLKSFVHRKPWEKTGIVQWTRGEYAAVRWVEREESFNNLEISKFPVTQRGISELELFAATNLDSGQPDLLAAGQRMEGKL